MAFEFQPPREFEPVDRRERYLPHWEQCGCTYFLTWRMADSLPDSVLAPWIAERKTFCDAHPRPWDGETQRDYEQKFTRRVEAWLDAGHGTCALRQPESRGIVEESLRHFDAVRYDLHAWVIMPNHVHVLVRPRDGWSLERILHTWKSYTASQINRHLGTRGTFWMDETYDHIVRSLAELHHYRDYIRQNPVKARLPDGEFSLWLGEE